MWEVKEAHPGGVSALSAGRAANGGPLMATGGRDGAVRLWSAGRGTPLQALDTAQYSRGACTSHDCLQKGGKRERPAAVTAPFACGVPTAVFQRVEIIGKKRPAAATAPFACGPPAAGRRYGHWTQRSACGVRAPSGFFSEVSRKSKELLQL